MSVACPHGVADFRGADLPVVVFEVAVFGMDSKLACKLQHVGDTSVTKV
jgi:hypothetical protein